MKHILLTRFAMIRPNWTISDSWLSDRYELLERYTLPSVEAQTCKNFKWVLIADPSFPEIDRCRLESYTDVAWVVKDDYAKAIQPYIENTDWVVTTRLDSDDVICNTFIEGVQSAFIEREMWYSYSRGYVAKGDRAFARTMWNSPFVSYGEPTTGAKTVYWLPHMKAGQLRGDIDGQLRKGLHVIDLGDTPAWVQIDHGGNILNSVSRMHKLGRADRKGVNVTSLKQFTCNW